MIMQGCTYFKLFSKPFEEKPAIRYKITDLDLQIIMHAASTCIVEWTDLITWSRFHLSYSSFIKIS